MQDEASHYTRGQAQVLTGLDSQTLDYWTRLGILKPASGSSGKGHHRKYDQFQITLGRILKEAAEFGLGGKSLTMMATEFQNSIDWYSANGLTNYATAASSLIDYRHDLERQGYVDFNITSQTPPHNVLQRIEKGDWNGLVAFHQQMLPLPDGVVEKCKNISFDEMRLHYDRFIALMPPGDRRSMAGEIFLFKNCDGGWEIDFEVEPKKARSFITIRLRDIKRELWRQS